MSSNYLSLFPPRSHKKSPSHISRHLIAQPPRSQQLPPSSHPFSPQCFEFMATLDDKERMSTYDTVYDSLLTMPKHLVLAQVTYSVHFSRHIVANNVWDYRPPRGSEAFETILVGEIQPALCGTRFSAKGNHFMGSLFNVCHHLSSSCVSASSESCCPLKATLIEDKTRVKNVFVLGKPSDAPACLGDLFDNQIATLCDVVEQDKREVSGKVSRLLLCRSCYLRICRTSRSRSGLCMQMLEIQAVLTTLSLSQNPCTQLLCPPRAANTPMAELRKKS